MQELAKLEIHPVLLKWPTGSKQLESEELCQIGKLWKEEYSKGQN